MLVRTLTFASIFVATVAYAGGDEGSKQLSKPLVKHAHHQAKSAPSCMRSMGAYDHANHKMHAGMNFAYSGDADIDFARGMIPHHQGAVDMANVQLEFGKDEELKALSRRIITWQEAEIGMMQQWLDAHSSSYRAADADSYTSVIAYKAAMNTMHKDMAIHYTGNADVDFARGMIAHHQGAIDMAWVLKAWGREPMLRELADDIIRSQAQEIKLMQDWLVAHPAPEAPALKGKHKKKYKKAVHHAHH